MKKGERKFRGAKYGPPTIARRPKIRVVIKVSDTRHRHIYYSRPSLAFKRAYEECAKGTVRILFKGRLLAVIGPGGPYSW